jgi:hypothetical protein
MRALIVVVSLLVLSSAGVASAKTLSTRPTSVDVGALGFVGCLVTNVSAKPIGPVDIDILDETGAELIGGTVASIAPEQTISFLPSNSVLGALGIVRCRVSGKGVASKKTLITLCVFPPGSLGCQSSVTVP